MPTPPPIPAFLSAEHVLEIQRNVELTIGWASWPVGYSNAKRRRLIVKRLSECGFCINTFTVKASTLTAFDIDDQDDFQADAVISGICFVRAFYDATANTGQIYAGKPVVYDSVTGKCITGINPAWSADEYRVIGTSLVDYDEITAAADGGEDIPIELLQDTPIRGNLFFKTPTGGIPAGNKTTGLLRSAKCKLYQDVATITAGERQLEPILEGGVQKEVDVYNLSAAIVGDKFMAAETLERSGTILINIDPC